MNVMSHFSIITPFWFVFNMIFQYVKIILFRDVINTFRGGGLERSTQRFVDWLIYVRETLYNENLSN